MTKIVKKVKTGVKELSKQFLVATTFSTYESDIKTATCVIIPTEEEAKKLNADIQASCGDFGEESDEGCSNSIGAYYINNPDLDLEKGFKKAVVKNILDEALEISQKKGLYTIRSGPDMRTVATGRLSDTISVLTSKGVVTKFLVLESGIIESGGQVVVEGVEPVSPYDNCEEEYDIICQINYNKLLKESIATGLDCFSASVAGLMLADRAGRIKMNRDEKERLANVLYPNSQLTCACIFNVFRGISVLEHDNMRIWSGGVCYLEDYVSLFKEWKSKYGTAKAVKKDLSKIPKAKLQASVSTYYKDHEYLAFLDDVYTETMEALAYKDPFESVHSVIMNRSRRMRASEVNGGAVAALTKIRQNTCQQHIIFINDCVRLLKNGLNNEQCTKMSNYMMSCIIAYNFKKNRAKADNKDKEAAVGNTVEGPVPTQEDIVEQ